jgi:hypothetical protein
MSRWRAFTTHLLISAAVIAAVAALVLVLWYPPDLFRLGNLGRLIGIIAIVDVVIGPIITLIIFRSGKPGLKLDLAIIAVLQAGLLAYGLHVLIGNRPVFMVWVGDRFELVRARDIAKEDLALAPDPIGKLSWFGPSWVAAIQPEDPDARQALLVDALEGRDIHTQPRYFRRFEAIPTSELLRAEGVDALIPGLTSDELAEITRASGGKPANSMKYSHITNSARDSATMLIDAESGIPIGIADLDAWEVKARTLPQR